MSPGQPGRRNRLAGCLLGIAIGGGLLTGCGGSGSASLAHKACVEVDRSIALYKKAGNESGAAATRDRGGALVDLRDALRPAALAGSGGGQWQALLATLSESSRVPEGDLITGLTAQCSPLPS